MRIRPAQNRSGVTLIELLIVLAILATLAALLVPAVIRVRETAARTECASNLRQIALAFHTHHEQLKYFPTGGWNWADPPTFGPDGIPRVGAEQRGGWGYQILPFLGAENIWNGGDGTNNQERVLVAIGTPLSVYFCPSRRQPMVYAYCPPRPRSDPFAENIYELNFWSRPPIYTAQSDYVASNYNPEQKGIVRRKEPRRMADIRCGLACTLLAGEKRMNLRVLGSLDVNNDQGYADGWDGDTVGRTDVQPGLDVNVGSVQSVFLIRPPFGASHPRSFNTAFADGSVRRVAYEVRLSVFTALGDIQRVPSGSFLENEEIK